MISIKIKKFTLGYGTNAYLIIIKNEAILIDAPDGIFEIINYLDENKIKLKTMLLTHGHFDHILGASEIKKLYPNIKSYAGIEDKDWFIGTCNNIYIPASFTPSNWLGGGEEIMFLEKKIKVFKTPGHSKGSLTYKIDNNLFTGDFIFSQAIGRCDLFGGSNFDMKKSLKWLLSEKENYSIFPGHGSNTTLNSEKENNYYLQMVK